MKDFTVLLFTISVIVIVHTSNTNSVTSQNSAALLPSNDLFKVAGYKYRQFVRSNEILHPAHDRNAYMVKLTGERLANAINQYFAGKGLSPELAGIKWEFQVVNRKEANLWCMPGGKMIVYKGFFPYIQSESELAILMAHEMAHELAEHVNENMCQQIAAMGLDIEKCKVSPENPLMQELFSGFFRSDRKPEKISPYTAKQETEADHFSLIFTALAGFDPGESWGVWKRLDRLQATEKPTYVICHPSEIGREDEMDSSSEEAMDYYKPAQGASRQVGIKKEQP